ncbi:hypothetical protein BTVI_135676 [Pitangus sulphuratus]|nr:hypothetical protein BTVI_135676 [Pitangus sulphuratus]
MTSPRLGSEYQQLLRIKVTAQALRASQHAITTTGPSQGEGRKHSTERSPKDAVIKVNTEVEPHNKINVIKQQSQK